MMADVAVVRSLHDLAVEAVSAVCAFFVAALAAVSMAVRVAAPGHSAPGTRKSGER